MARQTWVDEKTELLKGAEQEFASWVAREELHDIAARPEAVTKLRTAFGAGWLAALQAHDGISKT
jgi:hypothetical protein